MTNQFVAGVSSGCMVEVADGGLGSIWPVFSNWISYGWSVILAFLAFALQFMACVALNQIFG